MSNISVPNPTILNSETSDVTKLTANDNAIISGLTDGTKDINIGAATATSLVFGSGSTLSNYVVSTWTPTVTLVGGTGNATPVYSTNEARYTRIGNRVHFNVYLDGDGGTEGAGTGGITIAIPIAASSSMTRAHILGYGFNGSTTFILLGTIAALGSTISVEYYNTISTTTSVTGADQNNTSRRIAFNGWYEV